MKSRLALAVVIFAISGMALLAQSSAKPHLNPMVDLLLQHKPVFGVYFPGPQNLPGATPPPANAQGGGGGRGAGAPLRVADGYPQQEDPCGEAMGLIKNPEKSVPLTADEAKVRDEIAKFALTHKEPDYLFSGDLEGGIDRAPTARGPSPFPAFTRLLKTLSTSGHVVPVMMKSPKIGCDLKTAGDAVSRELSLGITGLMFPHTQSAKELQAGLAAMRPKSKGGTRSDDIGQAAQIWGLTPQQYKEKADLYSMNPNGELVNFTIIEDKEGLAHVREIAKTKGIGVLWPGAGTLGGVFYKNNGQGNWVRDDEAWEKSIQTILSACKEFNVPCGYPSNNWDDPRGGMELRMKQGFSVFVSGWSDAAFAGMNNGKKAASR